MAIIALMLAVWGVVVLIGLLAGVGKRENARRQQRPRNNRQPPLV